MSSITTETQTKTFPYFFIRPLLEDRAEIRDFSKPFLERIEVITNSFCDFLTFSWPRHFSVRYRIE